MLVKLHGCWYLTGKQTFHCLYCKKYGGGAKFCDMQATLYSPLPPPSFHGNLAVAYPVLYRTQHTIQFTVYFLSVYLTCSSTLHTSRPVTGPVWPQRVPGGFRLPDFHDIRHVKVVRSSASRTGSLYPQECSWYSFLPRAVSTPGTWCGRKEICHRKIQWHHRESIPGPSD
jgi:hypothetical protein